MDMESLAQWEITEEKVEVPPLVIYSNIENHRQTMKNLSEDLQEDFSFKCNRNSIVIYTKNMNDYKKISEKITAAHVPYYTHTPISEKSVISSLRGLASNITEEDVKTDLTEKNVKIVEMKQFVKKVADPQGKTVDVKLPIFSIKFDKETKVAEFKNVKYVCWCKVECEKCFNPKTITQCYR